jgi:nitrite reductase/ring-hydroxylating ferredoxin subunit/uncharacterized membrane protein
MATAPPDDTWIAGEAKRPTLHRLAEGIGQLEQVDESAEKLATAVRGQLGSGTVKDALSGTWLGHTLHPLMTDVPIGAWTSATVLDLIGGRGTDEAAQRLVGIGLLASVPTVASGLSDWADTTLTSDSVRRVGLVHAAANGVAMVLYAASWTARRGGRHGRGKLLSLAGAGALAFSGHLGGHLSYAKGVGVDQTTFESGVEEWTAAMADADLAEGEATAVEVGDLAVMLARHGGRVFALRDRCNHRGGPLHQGEIADGCVTCPWHASVFSLADGGVVGGPASVPQPAYDVRVREGSIEVRAAAARA